jgi:hypothetical protein
VLKSRAYVNKNMPTQAWTAFRSALTRFEGSKIVPEIAVRNALGFTAAIAIATIVRSPAAGAIAGTGALNVSYSDSRDPYSLRARRILVASVLCGLAVTLGSLSGYTNSTAVLAPLCGRSPRGCWWRWEARPAIWA